MDSPIIQATQMPGQKGAFTPSISIDQLVKLQFQQDLDKTKLIEENKEEIAELQASIDMAKLEAYEKIGFQREEAIQLICRGR